MYFDHILDASNRQPATPEEQQNITQYKQAQITRKDEVVIVKDTIIQAVPRVPAEITMWRTAHQVAESRYYPNRTALYNLYDDCLLDGHLWGIIEKRIKKVLNKTLYFEKDGVKVDEMDNLINGIPFTRLCRLILESVFWGISGAEFIPGNVFEFKPIPRKHIKTKWQVISYDQNGNTGVDYTTAKNLWIIGEPEDLGALLRCIPYTIYKRQNTGDWAQFIEIYGQPVRVMYYDAFDQQAKIELKQTLDQSGSSLALMIPKGTEFEMKDGKASNGDGQLQNTFKNFLNEEMSVIILGNTETTTHGGGTGTGAKTKEHAKQQNEIEADDLALLTAYLNSEHFLGILEDYGYPIKGGQFKFTQEIKIDEQVQQIDIDVKLKKDLGLPLDHDQLYQYYGRAKPSNYEAMLLQMHEDNETPAQEQTEENNGENEQEELKALLPDKPKPNMSARKTARLANALRDFFAPARR
ncbi:MAG: DUF935 family protein [Chitinophagia bacterium]|nr:DUF935 family protein [Chitinophagia bacterium]